MIILTPDQRDHYKRFPLYLVCAFVGQACSTIGWSNRGKLNGKKNSGTVQCVTSQSGHSACVSSNYLARRTMESNEVGRRHCVCSKITNYTRTCRYVSFSEEEPVLGQGHDLKEAELT